MKFHIGRHVHEFVYTGDMIQCVKCWEVFEKGKAPPKSRMPHVPVLKIGLLSILIAVTILVVVSQADAAEAEGLPALEKEYELLVFEYTNAERVRHGLAPLLPDIEIAGVARYHSSDMLNRAYFEHYSPEGDSAIARAEIFGIECVKHYDGYYTFGLAENIFYMRGYDFGNIDANSHFIVDGLMDSPEHREAILDVEYDKLGVGIRMGDGYIYVTQNFC